MSPRFVSLLLLGAIFAPFVLMAVLVWRYAEHRQEVEEDSTGQAAGDKQ